MTRDDAAAAELLPLVYDEMRGLAKGHLARERRDHTLGPTALVHEAYLRLAGEDREWKSRSHFLAAAAIAMRHVLVDYARRRGAKKRGSGGNRVTLHTADVPGTDRELEVLEIDELLRQLATLDERKSRVVELRFFAGMSLEEIAEALDVARSTVAEDWTVARAWLASRLEA